MTARPLSSWASSPSCTSNVLEARIVLLLFKPTLSMWFPAAEIQFRLKSSRTKTEDMGSSFDASKDAAMSPRLLLHKTR
jgi:hypothetical protein